MESDAVPALLQPERAVLVVVDIQERFADLIHHMDRVIERSQRLIRFCQALELPILVTEQYPRGLGRTMPPIAELCSGIAPLEKLHFSCAADDGFNAALAATGRDQIILCGIETHVCVYQTAADLRRRGLQVVVAADAVSSGSKDNRKLGLRAMGALGVQILGSQMIMFEILRRAGTPEFKRCADLLRGD